MKAPKSEKDAAKSDARQETKRKLAAALRENLVRRKAQARASGSPSVTTSDDKA